MKLNKYNILCFFILAILGLGNIQAQNKETIKKTLEFSEPKKSKKVIVDNIWGSINVRGHRGNTVEAVIQKTVKAETENDREKARDEVKLEISELNNEIEFYVDGPFRDDEDKRKKRFNNQIDYEVRYDFELKVPYECELYLRNVTNGDVSVKNIKGDFDVKNISGAVEMVEMEGSGKAYALSEDLKVVFKKNPQSDSYFGSLSGDVDVYFLKNFTADCMVKTFTGDIYSDFDVSYIPNPPATKKVKSGKFVYKREGYMGVRIGKGGPKIKFDGFSGDIHIVNREK